MKKEFRFLVGILTLGFTLPPRCAAVDFAQPQNYPVGTNPSAVVVGDFNGDGKPDLAVVNSSSNNVSILLGNGDGTFQPAVNFDAGLSPNSIAVGDFTGDGKLDLALFQPGDPTNSIEGALSILLGNGNGSFQAAKSLTLTPVAVQMAVADFNADRKSDLAVMDVNRGTKDCNVNILFGNGDGTFQVAKKTALPSGCNAAVEADVTGDAKADLVVTAPGQIFIFAGKGDGTFQQVSTVMVTETFNVGALQVVDVNHDGKMDLLVESSAFFHSADPEGRQSYTTHISIFQGNDNGMFQAEQIVTAAAYGKENVFGPVRGTSVDTAILGDFNGDGKVDLAYRKHTFPAFHVPPLPARTSMEILLGKGNGTFSQAIILSDPGPDVLSASLNSDKLSDLLVVGPGNAVSVILNSSPTSGADLGITQASASPEPVGVGTNLTYTANVINEGPQDATGVKFTDTLPNGVNFVSATATRGSCIQSHGAITCSIGSLASAFDAQITIVVTPTAAGTISNTISVAATEPDSATANNSATQDSTVVSVYTLRVAIAGDGSGSVTSTPLGIDCANTGGTCTVRSIFSGTLFILAPAPLGNSTFAGWTGACSGPFDPSQCNVIMSSDQTITAKFSLPPDFTLSPAATSLNVKRGGQTSETLTFAAQGGFSGTIALTCSLSGPPPMPTCGISPASVTPGTNATLTVNALALSAALTAPWLEQGARLYAAWLPLGLLGCVLATGFDKKRRRRWALCLLMLAAMILPTACGGGNSTPIKGLPSQNFTVTVTATSGTIQHTTSINVIVN